MYSKADIADSIAVARHACQDAGELELVGICSGSWYAAHAARNIGAQSAILVNLVAWNWRVTPTLLQQWYFVKKALHLKRLPTRLVTRAAAPPNPGGQSASKHLSTRLGIGRRALCTTTSRDTSCGC